MLVLVLGGITVFGYGRYFYIYLDYVYQTIP